MAVSTLRDYLEVLKRRKWVVLIPLVLVPVVAVVLSLRQPAVYEASAEVLISSENVAAQLQNLSTPVTDPARTVKTQAQLARSPTVARGALEAANVDRDPSELLGASSVSPSPETDLLVFRVKDGDRQLAASLADAYAREFTTYLDALESDALKAARARVRSELEGLEARGRQTSATYQALVQTNQELMTMEVLQTEPAAVVRPATGASQTQPQPKRSGLIGLLLGLVLAIAFAFLYEALDSRARSAHEVAERLRLPLLGRIPRPPRDIRNSRQIAMFAAPYSKDAEAFRMLRTNVEFAALDRGARVLMVTSAQAGEGKSTTIANLAIAFAHAGQRTILVDFDMRNSFLESLFGLEGAPGVSDVMSGDITLDQALVRSPSPRGTGLSPMFGGLAENHFWVLPWGSVSNAANVGGSRGLTETMRALSERADIVLVDAPPILITGDAMALTAYVDGIMLVVRANLIRAAALDELRRVLDIVPGQKLGFVLTGSHDVGDYHPYGYVPSAGDLRPAQHPRSDTDSQWQSQGAAMVTRQPK